MLCAIAVAVSASPKCAGAAPDLTVAVVATASSPHQPHGEAPVAAIEERAQRLNQSGGVAGRHVSVKTFTEDCTRAQATRVANSVAALRPDVVIGHLCRVAALAAAEIYARAGILFIAPGVREPRLTAPAAGPLVFRLAGRDDRFAQETAAFVAATYPGRSVAMVTDRTRQAQRLTASLTRALNDLSVPIARREELESGEVTYDDAAKRIAATNAGVVIMPAQPIELAILTDGLRRLGVDAPVIGSDILAVPDIEGLAQREGKRLVLMLPWTGLGSSSPMDAATTSPHASTASTAPSPVADAKLAVARRAEAALQAWAHAVARAGSSEPHKVADLLRQETAPTVVGPLGFDAAGDARVPSYLPHTWTKTGWKRLDAIHPANSMKP
ncbi:MAG: ABC transporter substrate-binding protein [Hyphomicrobiaceae bacterium]